MGARTSRAASAFTLIEVIVVLALVLGIAAVVLPLSISDSHRAALREAEATLDAAMLSARADAQRMGRKVRLVATFSDDRWLLREEEPVERDASAEPVRAPRVLHEVALPPGVRLARTREEAEGTPAGDAPDADVEADNLLDIEAEGEAGVEGAPLQIAMILPDGQISPTRPLYLAGPDGRVASVTVNSWTGSVTTTLLPPRSDEFAEPDAGTSGEGELEPR